MLIVGEHRIHDPRQFWAVLNDLVAQPPPGVGLWMRLANAEGSHAISLWEAGEEKDVRQLFDYTVGHISVNSFFEVAEADAVGLPRRTPRTSSRRRRHPIREVDVQGLRVSSAEGRITEESPRRRESPASPPGPQGERS